MNMKKALSFAMALSVVATAAAPVSASAAGKRTKAEAFGDDTYKNRFLSLYDDVVTKGQENGYLSKNNTASGGFGVPYHSVETLIIEAPDYGHETTSEAMSYIVWVAAMHDVLSGQSGELSKAWKTMEVMIPDFQTGFWTQTPSATVSPELDTIEAYATAEAEMMQGNTATNPIWKNFTSAYSSDKGLYLMHWLADVDDWYGYGGGSGKFTFINTFQRGSMESCFETVPHPCKEELKYGNPNQGIKGVVKAPSELEVAPQWSYTNAPDAEDRAIQGVYLANRYGVGDSSVTTLAGKMGDELRNNMFDKYYKPIAVDTTINTPQSSGYESCHYLRNWYTSWGGANDGMWTWQIGCSHCHEFYQNPLAAYALLADSGLSSGMKAQNAKEDYQKSLARQLEFYLWLQASNGPIAGGATNSNRGRYAPYSEGILTEEGTTQNVSATFYDMLYVEHPVYLDPGSNHWIGNQVWALQRLAELYYDVVTNGDNSGGVKVAGMSIEDALKQILDKWVEWALKDVVKITDGGKSFEVAENLDWKGEPDTWTGTPSANSGLTATTRDWGTGDFGCYASLANTLIYYAAANKVDAADATNASASSTAGKALYTAKCLLDCMWELGRDDIGLTLPSSNGSLKRVFEQEVVVPSYYTGEMPNGDKITQGIKFIDIRTKYKEDPMFAKLEADYNATGTTENAEFEYHRFWHAGDIMMANAAMALLYPDVTPDGSAADDTTTTTEATTEDTTTTTKATTEDTTTTTKATTEDTTTTTKATTEDTTTTKDTTASSGNLDVTAKLWGDLNCDGAVDVRDVALGAQVLVKLKDLTPQGIANGDVRTQNGVFELGELTHIKRFLIKDIDSLDPSAN